MNRHVTRYLSEIGRRGGLKSRRTLAPETARQMVRIREARRAFKRFHTQCFWSFRPSYRITGKDVAWVGEQLRKYGGREAYAIGVKLCR